MSALEVVGTVLLVVGVLVFVVGAVGLVRLPDALARLMPVTLVGTVGMAFVLAATWCFHPGWVTGLKVVAVGILMPLTSAAGSSTLARATYMRGAPMDPVYDDLAEYQRAERAEEEGGDGPPGVTKPEQS